MGIPEFLWVGMALSCLGAVVGFPCQIYSNYKKGSCEGYALPGPFISLFACSSWLIGASMEEHPALLLSQIPGLIFLIVIMGQFTFYWLRERRMKQATVETTTETDGQAGPEIELEPEGASS